MPRGSRRDAEATGRDGRPLVEPDAKRPEVYVAQLAQGGTGLPDRDFYLKPENKGLLTAYQEHVARMLGFLGETPAAASEQAARIVAFETELATIALPRAELRDPDKTYNLVGVTGLLGGRHMSQLNEGFMNHSVHEVHTVGDIRNALGEVRQHEKDMVIDYEDGIAVLKHREAWAASAAQAKKSLEALLEGAEDEDNVHARAALKALDAYVAESRPVLDAVQNGAFDTAKVADRRLDKAKGHVQEVERSIAEIARIVRDEVTERRAEFAASMRNTLYVFAALLALALLVVVPLTLLNSRSIVQPVEHAQQIAQAIASGDLTRRMRVGSQNLLPIK